MQSDSRRRNFKREIRYAIVTIGCRWARLCFSSLLPFLPLLLSSFLAPPLLDDVEGFGAARLSVSRRDDGTGRRPLLSDGNVRCRYAVAHCFVSTARMLSSSSTFIRLCAAENDATFNLATISAGQYFKKQRSSYSLRGEALTLTLASFLRVIYTDRMNTKYCHRINLIPRRLYK